MSDVPALNTAQDWVTVDEAAWAFEKTGVREGEAVLNAAIRSGHVGVRGKSAENPVYEELPESERREVMKDFVSHRGMTDFQLDWMALRSFLMQQQQIPNVAKLPLRMERNVSLAQLVPPAGARAPRQMAAYGVQAPGHGWWLSERDPRAEPQGALGNLSPESEPAPEPRPQDETQQQDDAGPRRGRRTE